jgi:superoxide dismutase
MQQQQLAPQESSYQSSRAEALHNVEATIVELGSIFTQLAEMVAAQGEMTQRIDENVEETLGNVDNAKAQLMKYLNNISSNRWLMMKVRDVGSCGRQSRVLAVGGLFRVGFVECGWEVGTAHLPLLFQREASAGC